MTTKREDDEDGDELEKIEIRTEKQKKEEERKYHASVVRFQFLNKIIGFVRLITGELGKLLKHTTGLGYVHTIRELYDFEGFSFYADIGQSMMGGNTVKIWYHPGSQYEKKLIPVLNIWWQTEVEYAKVERFEPDRKWQNELIRIIERRRIHSTPAKKVLTKYEEEIREMRHAGKVN